MRAASARNFAAAGLSRPLGVVTTRRYSRSASRVGSRLPESISFRPVVVRRGRTDAAATVL
ncbi:hypothetical protein ADK90_36540 [Streptomyces sp. XY413]|nr:hypothetical protein ADK90_36540 [Streptomyces sp. XY413]